MNWSTPAKINSMIRTILISVLGLQNSSSNSKDIKTNNKDILRNNMDMRGRNNRVIRRNNRNREDTECRNNPSMERLKKKESSEIIPNADNVTSVDLQQ